MYPSDDHRKHRSSFRLLHTAAHFYARAYQGLHQHNRCPIAPSGPALVAANHTAGLDPVMVQAACPRPISWVMTREFYDLPWLRPLLAWIEMIPIDRGGHDPRAWREALRALKAGRVVGVFPEGRIERTRELMPFQTGVALLATRGGADIYPVYLDGQQRNTPMLRTFLAPQSPSVAWGQPLRVQKRSRDLEALSASLQARVEELRLRYPAPRTRGRTMLRGYDEAP